MRDSALVMHKAYAIENLLEYGTAELFIVAGDFVDHIEEKVILCAVLKDYESNEACGMSILLLFNCISPTLKAFT